MTNDVVVVICAVLLFIIGYSHCKVKCDESLYLLVYHLLKRSCELEGAVSAAFLRLLANSSRLLFLYPLHPIVLK